MAKRYPLCGRADTYREPSDKSIELVGRNRKVVPHACIVDTVLLSSWHNVTQRNAISWRTNRDRSAEPDGSLSDTSVIDNSFLFFFFFVSSDRGERRSRYREAVSHLTMSAVWHNAKSLTVYFDNERGSYPYLTTYARGKAGKTFLIRI